MDLGSVLCKDVEVGGAARSALAAVTAVLLLVLRCPLSLSPGAVARQAGTPAQGVGTDSETRLLRRPGAQELHTQRAG